VTSPETFDGVEDVQRPAPVEGHVVGDVDEGVDGAQADRLEPPPHPLGRGAIAHASHQTKREGGAEVTLVGGEVEPDRDRARSASRDRLDALRLERAEARGSEVACDSAHARAVRPVRRQVDLDQRVIQSRNAGIGGAGRGAGRELDDAVGIVRHHEFGGRAQHAPALDAADIGDPERDVLAGDVGAGRREDAE
jgi:hypothetical protein